MYRFFRIIKTTFQHVWRNLYLAVMTILIIVAASISAHILILTQSLTDSLERTLTSKIDITLYLASDVSSDGARELGVKIARLPDVEGINVETADDVYAEFLKRYEHEPETVKALKAVDANPFGPVVRVTAPSLEAYPRLQQALGDPGLAAEGVIERRSFDRRSDALERFARLARTARLTVEGTVAFFVLLSLFVVYHSIRMAIFSQREEIGIMKLVGAGNAFTRMPFVLEALIYALAAVAISTAIIIPTLTLIDPPIVVLFGDSGASVVRYYQSHVLWIAIFQVGGLSLAAMASAAVAVGRYLRV